MGSQIYIVRCLQTPTNSQMVINRLEKVWLSLINQKTLRNKEKPVAYSLRQLIKASKQIKILSRTSVVIIAKKFINLNSVGDKKYCLSYLKTTSSSYFLKIYLILMRNIIFRILLIKIILI